MVVIYHNLRYYYSIIAWDINLNIWEFNKFKKVILRKKVLSGKFYFKATMEQYEHIMYFISSSDNFDVAIEEGGTYTVTVAGEKAKGSVSFIVESNK